ncbi:hypothetical protein B0I35DRAFT_408438 [Stachybotrys elegans]|uniref:Uncharacterized protein n=1 Tax=Stachybotrys elegans TaxID=80388 RepID=A0A8K0SX99_9HYPO|nr:hypothetical protein B0I35DRAFT_408438 [Stachybotrys elegans]
MDSPSSRRDLHDADLDGILSRHRRDTSSTFRSGTPSPSDTPPLLSSPSLASSLGLSNGHSPLRNQVSNEDASSIRFGLARRLSHLAQQLTEGQDVDEPALSTEVDRLEKVLASPAPFTPQRRPLSLDMRSRSDMVVGGGMGMGGMGGLGSNFSSPPQSLFRSRFTDLSQSWLREREREREREAEEEERERQEMAKPALSMKQAKKIIAESTKLNEELTQVVNNLKARQEESEHIHSLLIERAERAAQRILFLQNRVSYLEDELQENDDELQHLRISLKAIEIQLPPHPDQELQRCIAVFKEDYRALKRRRANRTSLASALSFDSSLADSTVQVDSPGR